jgi:hypothetical protein
VLEQVVRHHQQVFAFDPRAAGKNRESVGSRPVIDASEFKRQTKPPGQVGQKPFQPLRLMARYDNKPACPALARTAHDVLERLSAEAIRGLRAPEVRDLLGKQGFDVVADSPTDFARWIAAESAKWSRVIKASGATAD